MPRIRTFKPEFFRSPDTAKASPQARILYMAMWSWANDEGVGETNLYGLLGFAFPDEDDLTVKDLQSLLKEVRGSYGVVFYEHAGRFYYSIPAWDKHQKTERRAAGRFPKPDDPDSYPDLRFGISEASEGNSSGVEGKTLAGTGEPRNLGSGNLGMGNLPVGATEVCHQSADDVAPAQKCPHHINTINPPDCGGCASAGREFKAWTKRQAQREQDELDEKRQKRQAVLDAVANCDDCDAYGRIEDGDVLTYCSKHPRLKEASNA